MNNLMLRFFVFICSISVSIVLFILAFVISEYSGWVSCDHLEIARHK